MEIFSGLEHVIVENESLAPYTALGIGGAAEYLASPTTTDELSRIVSACFESGIPIRIIGLGSNILVSDNGTPGVVVSLSAPEFCKIATTENGIFCGGGCRLSHFISVAVREGFVGPEQLVGIPATMGGALHGNTEAHGCDIGQWVRSATVMTRKGEILERSADELNFAYRQSSLNELAIISAEFQFERESANELTRRMQKCWILAKATQPVAGMNAGYIFKDPDGTSAQSLIDQAGLKGTRVGEVEIFARNSNFFIAHPGASSKEVLQLIELVQSKVETQFGIELQTGIEIW